MTLEDHINDTFVKDRHGIKTVAILEEVRKKKVILRCPKREDTFSETLADFEKYYCLKDNAVAAT